MRSALSEGLQAGSVPRQGAEQAHSVPPREQIAVDIPSQSPARHPVLGSSGENLDASYVGSFSSTSFGTSPGHGLGYLMRSRRRVPARQASREFNIRQLHSHDELGELAAAAGDEIDVGQGVMLSPREGADGTFAFPRGDLTAPLLPSYPSAENKTGVVSTETDEAQFTKAAVFGAINAVAGIPALVAYAAIVFRHAAYAPYIDLLSKLFFISSALHQTVFCLLSTLPFAMGQVQDVGIIFLSAMGTSIASLTLDAGRDAATALGTALFTMTVSTFLVGLATLFVARRSLARFVQYIPLPVMGGYLAYVGYFCLASGVGLGVSVEIGSLPSWMGLFHRLPLIKLAPTVVSCAIIMLTLQKAHHPVALPLILIALVAVFHLVLAISGISLPEAQASGWVLPPSKGAVKFWDLWKMYHFEDWSLSGIYFPAIWRQLAKATGLLLVVIFGSCMDIAAIQQDLPYKIDFDRELTTVGLSNMVTGAVGCGFTGSYIFSQSIITLRAGVRSRVNGWVIAGSEVLVFALPYSVVQYLPNYFLGALLLWFGVEISRDWLVLSYYRLSLTEYALLWITFGSIMTWGLEGGIAAGIISATLYFAYAYAQSQVQSFGAKRIRSSVVRTVEHQAALELLWQTGATTAQLQGFVFFGSAQSIGAKLHEAAERLAVSNGEAAQWRLEQAIERSIRSMGDEFSSCEKRERAVAALAASPRFLIIDLSRVTGMDSSGARMIASTVRELAALNLTPILAGAGHHGIVQLLQAHDVRLRMMRWPPDLRPRTPSSASLSSPWQEEPLQGSVWGEREGPLRKLNGEEALRATNDAVAVVVSGPAGTERVQEGDEGVESVGASVEPEAFTFTSLEEALRFCEDALLEVAVAFQLCTAPGSGTSLIDMLASHLEKLPLTAIDNAPAVASALRRYMTQRTIRRGEVLWHQNDPADELFLVERGVIRVDQFIRIAEEEAVDEGAAGPGEGPPIQVRTPSKRSLRVRSFELGPGCVAGSTDFYLSRPHGTRAVCASLACRILRLSRGGMERMAREAPGALNILQMVVMRANSADLSAAADAAAFVL